MSANPSSVSPSPASVLSSLSGLSVSKQIIPMSTRVPIGTVDRQERHDEERKM